MASSLKNLSDFTNSENISGIGIKVGIAVSEWNDKITGNLSRGCIETLKSQGVIEEDIYLISVPGSFELPMACKMIIQNRKPNVVIALGCVIQGETKHDDYINHAVASGLTQLSLISNIPCIYGIVTTNDLDQALNRSGGKHGNKGVEAAITALRMANLNKDISEREKKIGF